MSTQLFVQKISNIHTTEDDEQVTIYYDLIGTQGSLCEVDIFCSDDWSRKLQSVTGAVGVNISPGKEKRITRVLQERPNFVGNFAFKIKAKTTSLLSVSSTFSAYTETVAGLSLPMLAIKGDTFTMGSPNSEPNHESDEKEHQVSLSDFYMAKSELSQA